MGVKETTVTSKSRSFTIDTPSVHKALGELIKNEIGSDCKNFNISIGPAETMISFVQVETKTILPADSSKKGNK